MLNVGDEPRPRAARHGAPPESIAAARHRVVAPPVPQRIRANRVPQP
jgi:hypothetical protein